MIAHRKGDLLVDIGCDQLRPPVAVICTDEADRRAVVQQAREDYFLVAAVSLRKPCALQHVYGRPEPKLEEVEQRRLVWHLWKARIVPHEVEPACGILTWQRPAWIAFSRGVDRGLDDHQLVHRLGELVVRHLGAMEIVHGLLLCRCSRNKQRGLEIFTIGQMYWIHQPPTRLGGHRGKNNGSPSRKMRAMAVAMD